MEFWQELLAAVGGAVGIVVLILVFAKGLIQKWKAVWKLLPKK